jgi:hypothetical protein
MCHYQKRSPLRIVLREVAVLGADMVRDPFEQASAMLQSEHLAVRLRGFERLGRSRDERAVPICITALGDREPLSIIQKAILSLQSLFDVHKEQRLCILETLLDLTCDGAHTGPTISMAGLASSAAANAFCECVKRIKEPKVVEEMSYKIGKLFFVEDAGELKPKSSDHALLAAQVLSPLRNPHAADLIASILKRCTTGFFASYVLKILTQHCDDELIHKELNRISKIPQETASELPPNFAPAWQAAAELIKKQYRVD